MWLETTVEDQKRGRERLPVLAGKRRRFLADWNALLADGAHTR